MRLYRIVIPLGTIIAQSPHPIDLNSSAIVRTLIPIYDPCFVSQREIIKYITKDLNGEFCTYSAEEAHRLNYVNPFDPKIPMNAISGDPIEDYIPINPSLNVLDTVVQLNPDHIIMIWECLDLNYNEEVISYINQIQGRISVNEIKQD